LTPLVRAFARRYGFVAVPKTDRWHKKPTAMLGGVAIWLSFVIISLDF
jgi:UDP-GlcNAc:undecaprenyl-phosphate GlcNAc-1-phosphate transferase